MLSRGEWHIPVEKLADEDRAHNQGQKQDTPGVRVKRANARCCTGVLAQPQGGHPLPSACFKRRRKAGAVGFLAVG